MVDQLKLMGERKYMSLRPGVFVPRSELPQGDLAAANAAESIGFNFGVIEDSDALALVKKNLRGQFNKEAVEKWLDDGSKSVNFQLQYYDWNSLLMEITRVGDPDLITRAIRRGANVNAKNGRGQTALMFAAANGHRQAVMLLLQSGAKLDIKDQNKHSALHHSVLANDPELFRILATRSKLIKKSKIREELILQAANMGSSKIVSYMLFNNLVDSKSELASRALAIANTKRQALFRTNLHLKDEDQEEVEPPDTSAYDATIEALKKAGVETRHMSIEKMYLG